MPASARLPQCAGGRQNLDPGHFECDASRIVAFGSPDFSTDDQIPRPLEQHPPGSGVTLQQLQALEHSS